MGALIDQLELIKVSYYQQSFSPSVTNWLPFYWKGYKQTTRYTYRIDIARNGNYEDIYTKFGRHTRKNIESAHAKAEILETDNLELFHALLRKTFERQGLETRTSYKFIQTLDKALKEKSARKIYLALDEKGIPHSISYIVFDNQWVYQLMSGTDPEYRDSQFKTLLIEKGIQFACETNRGFDFEGSMVPGIEEYFRQFNAIQEPYFSISKILSKNPLIKIAVNYKLKR